MQKMFSNATNYLFLEDEIYVFLSVMLLKLLLKMSIPSPVILATLSENVQKNGSG
jgi:hypothetical protein